MMLAKFIKEQNGNGIQVLSYLVFCSGLGNQD